MTIHHSYRGITVNLDLTINHWPFRRCSASARAAAAIEDGPFRSNLLGLTVDFRSITAVILPEVSWSFEDIEAMRQEALRELNLEFEVELRESEAIVREIQEDKAEKWEGKADEAIARQAMTRFEKEWTDHWRGQL